MRRESIGKESGRNERYRKESELIVSRKCDDLLVVW